MRWTIVLQCSDEAGNMQQSADVLTLERDIEPALSALGLLNREAKQLLLRLQRLVVRQQAAAFCKHVRFCSKGLQSLSRKKLRFTVPSYSTAYIRPCA